MPQFTPEQLEHRRQRMAEAEGLAGSGTQTACAMARTPLPEKALAGTCTATWMAARQQLAKAGRPPTQNCRPYWRRGINSPTTWGQAVLKPVI